MLPIITADVSINNKLEIIAAPGIKYSNLIVIQYAETHPDFGNACIARCWILIHRQSKRYLATFGIDELRFAKAVAMLMDGWDWRGSDWKLISKETKRKFRELYQDLSLDKTTGQLTQERYRADIEQRSAQKRTGKGASEQLDLLQKQNVVSFGKRNG